jgi:hypothetical protein
VSTTTVEGAPVTARVIGVERVRGHGRLIGLAVVALDVCGVALTLQGVQLLRRADGAVDVRTPCFRRPTGAWLPAILLPPEVAQAITEELMEVRP